MRSRPGRRRPRRGAATVELAVLLPFLVFLFFIAADYARVFYFSLTVANAARNGAQYASDPVAARESPYASVEEAALADASDLSPAPKVTSASGKDESGDPYVEVTVTYEFQTVVQYPGIPSSVTLARRVRMRVTPAVPG
jgi:Flp pilus assembly protein TadG